MYLKDEYIEITPWDNDVEDSTTDDAVDSTEKNDGSENSLPKVGDRGADGKVFTQEDVERIVTKRNKSLKAEYEKLEKTYQDLLNQKNLSQEQRDELESRLENVQTQMLSKDEQAKREKKKVEERFGKELEEANARANKYQSLFERSTIERAIIDAAASEDAFNSELFISVLGPKSKIVDELDADGQSTGRLVPTVDWTITNDEGKSEEVRMTPTEVVKLMREDVNRFGGMFKSNISRGIGEGTSPAEQLRSGKIDPRKLSPSEYMKLAATKEGRVALGLEREGANQR